MLFYFIYPGRLLCSRPGLPLAPTALALYCLIHSNASSYRIFIDCQDRIESCIAFHFLFSIFMPSSGPRPPPPIIVFILQYITRARVVCHTIVLGRFLSMVWPFFLFHMLKNPPPLDFEISQSENGRSKRCKFSNFHIKFLDLDVVNFSKSLSI
jgi:hypothetical protein